MGFIITLLEIVFAIFILLGIFYWAITKCGCKLVELTKRISVYRNNKVKYTDTNNGEEIKLYKQMCDICKTTYVHINLEPSMIKTIIIDGKKYDVCNSCMNKINELYTSSNVVVTSEYLKNILKGGDDVR